jgi:hypothetical protein
MRELSKTLTELVDVANHVITRHGLTLGGDIVSGKFGQLAAEVRDAEARPAEGVRTTRAAMMMVFALEGFRETGRDGGERNLENQWLMLAGAVLPLLRVEAWVAFNNEKAARASS